jgi:hypothetical protein
MSKQLLIEEMKRAIMIMESKEEIKQYKQNGRWMDLDRETTELKQLLLMIRKHSIQLEKGIK